MTRQQWQEIRQSAWRIHRTRLIFAGQKMWMRVREPDDQSRNSRLSARARLEFMVSRIKSERTVGTIGWRIAMMRRAGC